jgi:hypothetical protein
MKQLIVFCLLIAPVMEVLSFGWGGPEPFRRERADSRPFSYNKESFVNRFSFHPLPVEYSDTIWSEDSFTGVAGSTRSNEFYVQTHLQVRTDFDIPMFAGVRFRRDEDFDGRFDRTLFGTGYRNGNWELGLWGDVQGAKQDMDLQLDLHWRGQNQQKLYASLIAPDALFNGKQSDARYEKKPYTVYVSGSKTLADKHRLYGFVNLNFATELQDFEQRQNLTDRQYSGGAGWLTELSVDWTLLMQIQGLYGERERTTLGGADNILYQLRRQFSDSLIQLRREDQGGREQWLGLRHTTLRERGTGAIADKPGQPFFEIRDETMVYAGIAWQWSPMVRLRPSVVLSYVQTDQSGTRLANRGDVDASQLMFSGFVGKLLPTIEFLVNKERGAIIAVNPSIELHEFAFGGGNVQLHIPF